MNKFFATVAMLAMAGTAVAQSPLLSNNRSDFPVISPENITSAPLETGGEITESAAVIFNGNDTGGFSAFAAATGPIGFEDYTSTSAGPIDVSIFRFVGGVQDVGGEMTVEFYDITGTTLLGGFVVNLPSAGNFFWTITLASGTVIADGAGVVQLVAGAATTGQWFMSATAPTIGTDDPLFGSGSSFALRHNFQLSNFPTTSGPYCFGDDLEDPQLCPCTNPDVAGGAGCANSTGSGAVLSASGVADTAADSFVLDASGLPATVTAIFFQGDGPTAAAGVGQPFGDGLRCAAGNIVRLEVSASDGSGNVSSSVSLSAVGGVASGETRSYQCWYRDTTGPCASGSNTSNAWLQEWL